MDTLVLNSAWIPVNRVSWMEAVCDLITGRAEVVEVYEDRVVRSGTGGSVPATFDPLRTEAEGVWLVPSIIRCVGKAVFFRGYVRFNRHNVWLRDRKQCQFCGVHLKVDEFTYDHVTPVSRGGQTRWENIVVACIKCNHRKGNRLPAEAGMRLLRKPFKPEHLPGQLSPALKWSEGMPDSWQSWLIGVTYWHGNLTP